MSDIPVSLVQYYADQGATEVYLPPSKTRSTTPQSTEQKAVRPDTRAAAESYFTDPDRLVGDKVADQTLSREQPIHRMMIYLHASGATAKDIATQTGYSHSAVVQVLRQPWARSRLVQILNETGRDRVKHFLTQEVAPSLEVLREIRDDREAPASARINSANAILDRALGKATVHVESTSKVTNIPAEAARLDAELRAVRSQLEAKGVTDGTPSTN